MTRRKEKQILRIPSEPYFHVLRQPYHLSEKDSMAEYYERYIKDSAGMLTIENTSYYKIIQAFAMRLRERPIIFATLDEAIGAHINDLLADENDNVFKIVSVEMMTFHGPTPEWYFKTSCYVLESENIVIGEYLSNCNTQGTK